MSRSFTLLETAVAAALLAMLAASAVSALRSIALAADRAGGAVDVGAFSLIVDDLLAEPAAYGLPKLADGSAWHGARVRHPDAEILIRWTATEADPSATGAPLRHDAWLVFETDGAAVARWCPRPEPREQVP